MSNLSQFFGGGKRKVQVFTSSGTWVRPQGVDAVDVLVCGGGGGGGGYASGGTSGTDGGNSSFGDIEAAGGKGGVGSATGNNAGGAGGGPFGGASDASGTGSGFVSGGGGGSGGGTSPAGACPGFASMPLPWNTTYGDRQGGASYGLGGVRPDNSDGSGYSALPNTGGGGSGATFPGTFYGGGGGGGGEVKMRTNHPVSGDVSVVVGAGGSGGAGARTGGNGGSGIVIVAWNE